MARWTTELTMLIALAAAGAVIAPRVLLPSLPHAVHTVATTPTAAPGAVHTVATAPEIVLDDPPDQDPTPAPRSAPAEAPGPAAALDRSHTEHEVPHPSAQPAVFSSGAITRRNGRWQVDLDRIEDPRHALAGVHLQPLGSEEAGEGFAITRTDSQGLLRAAGIRPGDVLVAVNDMPTLNPDQALDVLARYRHASSLSFRFRRGGGSYTVNVDTHGDTRRLHGSQMQAAMPTRGS